MEGWKIGKLEGWKGGRVEGWKREDWKIELEGGEGDMPPFGRSLCVLCDRRCNWKKDLRRFSLLEVKVSNPIRQPKIINLRSNLLSPFHPFLPSFLIFPPSNLPLFQSYSFLVNLIQKVDDFVFTQKKVIVPVPLLLFCLKRFNLPK